MTDDQTSVCPLSGKAFGWDGDDSGQPWKGAATEAVLFDAGQTDSKVIF